MPDDLNSTSFNHSNVFDITEARQTLEELIDLAIAGEPVFISVDLEHRLQFVPLYR